MSHDAKFWIRRRMEIWEKHHDLELDRRFREAVADEMMENTEFRLEIKRNPEYLIELEFVIVDKKKQVVPFFLNEVQHDFMKRLNESIKKFSEGKLSSLSFLVLKGRQQGFTSFITAYQLACCVLKRNFEGFTLADAISNAQTIFENKAKFPHRNLPEPLKPTEKLNNRNEIRFIKLNSSWEVGVASKNVGRSRTINFFHGSEAAFWQVQMSDLQAALSPAMTEDCISIYESTADGFNDFKDMWDSGAYINCFYEWWRTPEYTTKFESRRKKEEFLDILKNGTGWIADRLRWLKGRNLKIGQLYWYYKTWEKLVDKDKIRQEYPCTAEEAFLMSGRPVFDLEKIVNRIAELKERYEKKPYTEGYFKFSWEETKTKNRIVDSTIRFTKSRQKPLIRIYEEPKKGIPYVIAGDTKGEGSDYYAATVIDNTSGRRVASLHMQVMTSYPYTHQIYCLGRYYNDALIGVEMNFNTGPIEELTRLRYPKQYVRRKYDEYTKKTEPRYGWKTDGNTRPLIIDKYAELISENIDLIVDIPTLQEALTFIYDDKGRPDAMDGKHDDLLMSDMIANQIREQQAFSPDRPEKPKKAYTKDMLEDWKNATDEERKLMVELWGAPE